MSSPASATGWASTQGHYAGAVSRCAAYAVDLVISWGLFMLALAGISYVASIATGHPIDYHGGNVIVLVAFAVWEFAYFGYCWAVNGRTPGMGLFGVRVVRADGGDIDPWRGVVRSLVFPLSFLLCGLGLAGILVQREHRALHDLIAGTAVVYGGVTTRVR